MLSACGARTELGDGHVASDDASASVDATSDVGAHDVAVDVVVDAPIWNGCVAQATMMLTPATWADEIVLTDNFVYFHSQDGIARVPKSGGPATPLAPPSVLGWPKPFAVDELGITFWKFTSGGKATSILHVALQGGAVTTLNTLSAEAWGCVSIPNSNGAVYFWGATSLTEMSGQGALQTVGNGIPSVTVQIAVDGTTPFLASESGVYRYESGSFQFVGTIPSLSSMALALDATDVFFIGGDPAGNRSLARVTKAGGTPAVLFSATQYEIAATAVDDAHVYVAGGASGDIYRMNKDGTSQSVIASVPGAGAVSIAVDDKCVYWISSLYGASQINVAPK